MSSSGSKPEGRRFKSRPRYHIYKRPSCGAVPICISSCVVGHCFRRALPRQHRLSVSAGPARYPRPPCSASTCVSCLHRSTPPSSATPLRRARTPGSARPTGPVRGDGDRLERIRDAALPPQHPLPLDLSLQRALTLVPKPLTLNTPGGSSHIQAGDGGAFTVLAGGAGELTLIST